MNGATKQKGKRKNKTFIVNGDIIHLFLLKHLQLFPYHSTKPALCLSNSGCVHLCEEYSSLGVHSI